MNSMNVLFIKAKIRRMVDFILKQDSGYFILDERWGLDGVLVIEEEVGVEAAFHDAKH